MAISIRFIQNQQELAAEGLAMQHCVGSYVDECTAGAAHILRIRSRDQQRLATVELRLTCRNEQYGFEVIQKRGPANTAIMPGEERALAPFLQLVHQPRDYIYVDQKDSKVYLNSVA